MSPTVPRTVQDSDRSRPIREVLREIGARRKRQDNDIVALALDTRQAVERAAEEKVPVIEAAALCGLHRTTIYKVYKTQAEA